MVRNYKCPGCGASMVYDEGTNCMVCQYCETKVPIEEIEKDIHTSEEDFGKEMSGIKAYHCPSCGAQIVTDANTAATFCSFCGSPTMMEDRLSGYYKPKFVIPFQIDKENAVQAFRKWTKRGIFTPSKFSSQTQLEKITGMYIPYWLYDYDTNVELQAHGKRIRKEIKGDTEYIYTKHYDVYRKVRIGYKQVPMNASNKMSEDQMERLEPFDYRGMKPFQMPYLAGFQAEKYNQTDKELEPQVEARVKEFAYQETLKTVYGYNDLDILHTYSKAQKEKAEYAMLPVWILSYQYKGKDAFITLNGQTGRLIGSLPISPVKVTAMFIGLTVFFFVLVLLIGGLVG